MVEEIEKYTDGRQGITKFTDKMNSDKDEAIKSINNYANELNGSDKTSLFEDLEAKKSAQAPAEVVEEPAAPTAPVAKKAHIAPAADPIEEMKEAKKE